MKKMKLRLLIGVITVMMLFTACGGNQGAVTDAENAEESKDSFIFCCGEPVVLDPQGTDASAALSVIYNIYETLIRYDEVTKEFVPCAAEEWSISEDGMEYTFYLSKGNKFHNGNELKADDVKYTFDRAKDSAYTTDYVACIKDVEVLDDYTVKINMKYAYSPMMNFIASQNLSIVNKEAVENAGDQFGSNPVGSGPYKIAKWVEGEKMLLEAYEDYHLGVAAMKNVTLKFIEDQSTAVIALQNGEFDILNNAPPVDKKTIMDDEKLEYYETIMGGLDYLIINTEVKHLSDKKVRQAIASVINLESIVDVLTEGFGYVANDFVPTSSFGYNKNAKRYPIDIEKAKKLLADAGYPEGFTTNIMVNEENGYKVAQVIQANLKEIGIECDILMYEFGTFLELEANGGFELSFDGMGFWGDADTGLYSLLHSSKIDSTNRCRYNNPQVDKLLDEGRVEVSREKRLEIYTELSDVLHENLPMIPLDMCTMTIAANSNIKGLSANSMGMYYYYDLSWK